MRNIIDLVSTLFVIVSLITVNTAQQSQPPRRRVAASAKATGGTPAANKVVIGSSTKQRQRPKLPPSPPAQLQALVSVLNYSITTSHQSSDDNRRGPKSLNWRIIEHRDGKTVLKSYLIYDSSLAADAAAATSNSTSNNGLMPAVLVIHDWDGRDEFENSKAEALAALGYVAYAVDLFGGVGGSPWRNDRLMQPFRHNRSLFLKRLQLARDELVTLPFVDADKLVAIGYSFGALGALDMARAGWDLRGAVSVHGTLGARNTTQTTSTKSTAPAAAGQHSADIVAKILVLHGYNDISNPPSSVRDFQREMAGRKADWQIQLYANTTGDFTKPGANVRGRSMYDAAADRRSWRAIRDFLAEVFEK